MSKPLGPTRAELFAVCDADVEEFCEIESKLDALWPGYKGMGEGVRNSDMFAVLLMLCAQLRRRVTALEGTAHPPLGQDAIYQRLEALERLMRQDGRLK